MEITEVRVAVREPMGRPGAEELRSGERRLKAYVTLTFDHCFVVRNIKIIDGKNGLFVAMPSHKPKVPCGQCHFKNDAGGRFCSQCGGALAAPPRDVVGGPSGAEPAEAQAHRDIAHPITAEFRQYLQEKVLEAYEAERARSSRHHAENASAHS
ncbi:MAG: septation protein SpoVG family protein [Candidatus Omnitrophica bacterium]|nr:septation protein SpoVG family protein [Candidatus Omnitrophota bacterium]